MGDDPLQSMSQSAKHKKGSSSSRGGVGGGGGNCIALNQSPYFQFHIFIFLIFIFLIFRPKFPVSPCKWMVSSLRSMAVLSGTLLSGEAIKSRAKPSRTSGEASREIKISLLPPPISSRFLCPRPPFLLCAPNQNRNASQARW